LLLAPTTRSSYRRHQKDGKEEARTMAWPRPSTSQRSGPEDASVSSAASSYALGPPARRASSSSSSSSSSLSLTPASEKRPPRAGGPALPEHEHREPVVAAAARWPRGCSREGELGRRTRGRGSEAGRGGERHWARAPRLCRAGATWPAVFEEETDWGGR
jgi:hypothetical protein